MYKKPIELKRRLSMNSSLCGPKTHNDGSLQFKVACWYLLERVIWRSFATWQSLEGADWKVLVDIYLVLEMGALFNVLVYPFFFR